MAEQLEELVKSIPSDYWESGVRHDLIRPMPRSKFYEAVELKAEHGIKFKKEGE